MRRVCLVLLFPCSCSRIFAGGDRELGRGKRLRVEALGNIVALAATTHSVALKADGTVLAWCSQACLSATFVHQTFQKRNFKYSGLVERLRTCLFAARQE